MVLLVFRPSFELWAQLVQDVRPLRSAGQIPEEFLLSSTEKYEARRKAIDNKVGKFEQAARERFYLESSFYVDALMQSGKVLFNDPVGKYINRVADELLRDDPGLRRQLRFYVIKSPDVNAFATERGSIFLNIGLLARLQTEAELAFVLAHEVSHYVHGHIIDNYLVAQYVDDEHGAYRQASRHEKMLAKSHYSQEQELEADLDGLARFLRTSYARQAPLGVIAMLSKRKHPYLEAPTGRPPFLNPFMGWQAYQALLPGPARPGLGNAHARTLPPAKQGEAHSRQTVSRSSHPQLGLRYQRLASVIEKAPDAGQDFRLAKRYFQVTRELARFEMVRLYVQQTAYVDALHDLQALMAAYPHEAFLRRNLAKALYGLAKYHFHGQVPEQVLIHLPVQQGATTLGKRLWELPRSDVHMLALAYVYDLMQQWPEDAYLSHLAADLLTDLIHMQGATAGGVAGGAGIGNLTAWTLARLERMQAEAGFQALYQRLRAEEQQRAANEEPARKQWGWGKPSQGRGKHPRTYRLGIDTLVVFGPVFHRVDQRGKQENPSQFIASERQQALLHRLIRRSARKLDLEVSLLDSRSLSEDDPAAHFNDIARIYAWHEELLRHGALHIICSTYDEVLPLVKRYGTPYFAHMGAFSLRATYQAEKLLVVIPTLAAPPVWPVFMYLAVKPNEASFFYTWVYDLHAHRCIMRDYTRTNMKTNETLLESNIYHDLWQIHKAPKRTAHK